MKKVALFAILGFFVAAFGFAQTEETTVIQQQPASTSEKTVVTKDGEVIATIEKIDVPTKTFTVKVDKDGVSKTTTYTFDDKTVFGSKEKMIKVEELKTGDVVVFETTPQNVIRKVRIKEITTTTTPPENK